MKNLNTLFSVGAAVYVLLSAVLFMDLTLGLGIFWQTSILAERNHLSVVLFDKIFV